VWRDKESKECRGVVEIYSLALVGLLHPCPRAEWLLFEARDGSARLVQVAARWQAEHEPAAASAARRVELPAPLQL
jgi:hypothetical protein